MPSSVSNKATDNSMQLTNSLFILSVPIIGTNVIFEKPNNIYGLHNGPKMWTRYNEKILFEFLSKKISLEHYTPKYVFHLLSFIDKFCTTKFAEKFYNRTDHVYCTKEDSYNSKRPSGHLKITMCWPQITEFYWHLLLDKRLRMKIHFHEIKIAVRHIGMCVPMHSLVISSLFKNKNKREMFQYCGILAFFTLYPPSNQLHFVLSCVQFVKSRTRMVCRRRHHIAFWYSVIDENIIESQSNIFRKTWPQTLQEKLVVKENRTILSHHIIVQKIRNIRVCVLSCITTQFYVFDGPTQKSSLLRSKGFLYKTSTFQVLVVLSSNPNCQDQVFRYIALTPKIVKTFHLNTSISVNFPLSLQRSESLADRLSIVAPVKYQVKAIITKIHFTGPISYQCMYGGITTLGEDEQEILSLCMPHEDTFQLSRHTYSAASMMHMIVYSYQALGDISVSSRFEATECHSVHIDPCLILFSCSYKMDQQMCDLTLGRSKYIKLKFEHLTSVVSTYRKAVLTYAPMQWNICVVLQVYSNHICHFGLNFYTCVLQVRHENVFDRTVALADFRTRLSFPLLDKNYDYLTPKVHMNWFDNVSVQRISGHQRFTVGQMNQVTFNVFDNIDLTSQFDIRNVNFLGHFLVYFEQYYSLSWFDIGLQFYKKSSLGQENIITCALGSGRHADYLYHKCLETSKHFFLLFKCFGEPTLQHHLQVQFGVRTPRMLVSERIQISVQLGKCLTIGKVYEAFLPLENMEFLLTDTCS